jgi:DNA-binding transcriptional ArsR family regulator
MKFDIQQLFKALSDPSRLKIFHTLMIVSVALPIGRIATEFNMSRQGVTKHIKILEMAGLIKISNQGRERFCQANPFALEEFVKWLKVYDEFWNQSLSNLASYLENKET